MRILPAIVPIAALAVVLPLLTGCGGTSLELSKKFQAAQHAFDVAHSPEDFLQVAALYEEILDAGGVSGAVLYNQGNAFMRAGEPGRAIAAYRRAKQYLPRDPFLEANLGYALAAENAAAQRRPLIRHVLFWQDWISYPAKFQLLAAVALVTLLLGIVALYRHPRLFGRLAMAGLVLTLLVCLSAGYDWYRFDCVTRGVIVRAEVTVRKGPNSDFQPAFTEPIREGTEFHLVQRRDRWLRIRLAGDQEGWVRDDAAVVY